MTKIKSINDNYWNPFIPTERDIERTNELAKKDPVVAGLLTLLFVPIGLIYLNRGVNVVKIIGYGLAITFIASMGATTEEEAETFGTGAGYAMAIAATVEQVKTVSKARERKLTNSQ
jgi:hypothetical protein